MPLSPEELRILTYAQGYLELSMFLDSLAELDTLPAAKSQLPEVLSVKLAIYQQSEQWDFMRSVAQKLVESIPDNPACLISLAYATRRTQSIAAARTILFKALEMHPEEALISYNLACYDCQLGDLPSAKIFLRVALRLDPKMRKMAKEDPDLVPLRYTLEE